MFGREVGWRHYWSNHIANDVFTGRIGMGEQGIASEDTKIKIMRGRGNIGHP
jgi:hypothetical protein